MRGIASSNSTNDNCWIVLGESDWEDYDYQVDLMKTGGQSRPLLEGVLVTFRIGGAGTHWQFNFMGEGGHGFLLQDVQGGKLQGDSTRKEPGSIHEGQWYDVLIKVRGQQIECYLDGALQLRGDFMGCERGPVGLGTVSTSGRFRRIKVTDPTGRILFSGLPELP